MEGTITRFFVYLIMGFIIVTIGLHLIAAFAGSLKAGTLGSGVTAFFSGFLSGAASTALGCFGPPLLYDWGWLPLPHVLRYVWAPIYMLLYVLAPAVGVVVTYQVARAVATHLSARSFGEGGAAAASGGVMRVAMMLVASVALAAASAALLYFVGPREEHPPPALIVMIVVIILATGAFFAVRSGRRPPP